MIIWVHWRHDHDGRVVNSVDAAYTVSETAARSDEASRTLVSHSHNWLVTADWFPAPFTLERAP